MAECLGSEECEHYKDGSCDKNSCHKCNAREDCIRDYHMIDADTAITRSFYNGHYLLIRKDRNTETYDSAEAIIIKLDVENFKGAVKLFKWNDISERIVLSYAQFRTAITQTSCCSIHQKVRDYLNITSKIM